jgi:hypothetical protein
MKRPDQITLSSLPRELIDALDKGTMKKVGKRFVKIRSRRDVAVEVLLDFFFPSARGGGGNRTRLETEGVAA